MTCTGPPWHGMRLLGGGRRGHGRVAALIARAQLVGLGADDPLTPPAARDPALARLRATYGAAGALEVHVAEGTGHVETPALRAAVLAFLAWHLRG